MPEYAEWLLRAVYLLQWLFGFRWGAKAPVHITNAVHKQRGYLLVADAGFQAKN